MSAQVRRLRMTRGTANLRQRIDTLSKRVTRIKKGQELKHATGLFDGAVPIAGVLRDVSLIAQGDGPTARDGNALAHRSMFFRYVATINANALVTEVRFMMVYDRAPNGALAAANDILENVNSISPLDFANAGRFQVLYDRTHILSITGNKAVFVKKYIKLSKNQKFNAAAAAAASQVRNSIIWLAISDEAVNEPVLSIDTTLRYTDS